MGRIIEPYAGLGAYSVRAMGLEAQRVDQVGRGEWQSVDFKSALKLRRTIEACDTREELEAWVVHGSQWPPFLRE